MSVLLVAATLVAGAAGWFAGGRQHLLYRQPEYRFAASGRQLRARQAALALSAAGAAALAFRPDHYDAGAAALVSLFSLALLVLASTDIERRLLPDRLMYPAVILAMACSWAWPDRSLTAIWIGGAVALSAGVLLFALGQGVGAAMRVRQTPFGLGDVKLIALLGFLLGWPAFLSALLFGVLAAGIPGLVLVVRGRARSVFSYGPFLVLGGLIVLLFPGGFV